MKKNSTKYDLKILKIIQSLNIENSEIWISEAFFGFSQIKEFCDNIKDDGNLLEVGSGSGILLSMLSEKYKNLNIEGIEPFGNGFHSLKKIYSKLSKKNIEIMNIGFEEFKPSKKYDLIFCINVFEHLEDWRNFLKISHSWLRKDGKLVILAPNNGFPFESHFKIPIIINKKLTYLIFKKFINKFEKNNKCRGLWKSLNFVKKSEIIFEYKRLFLKKYELYDQLSIMQKMIIRFTEDEQFRRRQKILGFISIFLKNIGLFRLIFLFPNFLPYMKLIFTKK